MVVRVSGSRGEENALVQNRGIVHVIHSQIAKDPFYISVKIRLLGIDTCFTKYYHFTNLGYSYHIASCQFYSLFVLPFIFQKK
jgi:hypothetical protein